MQIATFLGSIIGRWNALPALVVVPNSTITNWVRELERWAPKLRVVPFHGEKKGRDVIKEFELYHKVFSKHNTNAKFHVLVTTYDALINAKDFTSVFKHQPRWEVRRFGRPPFHQSFTFLLDSCSGWRSTAYDYFISTEALILIPFFSEKW